MDAGIYTSITEISEAEGIGKSYVRQDPAPGAARAEHLEEILDGRADHARVLAQLERPLPACWEEQRTNLR